MQVSQNYPKDQKGFGFSVRMSLEDGMKPTFKCFVEKK
jgi:hypothetical protein